MQKITFESLRILYQILDWTIKLPIELVDVFTLKLVKLTFYLYPKVSDIDILPLLNL